MGERSGWFDGEALSGLATAAEVQELRALVAAMPPDPEMERVLAEQVGEWVERCVKRRREAALQQQDLASLRDMYRAAEEVRRRGVAICATMRRSTGLGPRGALRSL